MTPTILALHNPQSYLERARGEGTSNAHVDNSSIRRYRNRAHSAGLFGWCCQSYQTNYQVKGEVRSERLV
ncbi:hypothetical protein UPYG_G00334370 [Umbra pygmaea]|uniref:Uncharacterized protein n=1 Tax=Umbra pygmaea TaxID=75934 RepID=A0ABD0W067_UMBPY